MFLMYLFIVSAEKQPLFRHLDLEIRFRKKIVHVIPLRGTFISDNDIQKHVLLKADITKEQNSARALTCKDF